MAGGIGSRLWPLSTPEVPKQFIDVLGVGKSLIQLTVERFALVCEPGNFWVVTGEKYVDLVKEQLPLLPPEQILAEPEGRNTAPCIAYASWKIQQKDPEANIVVTPADALVLKTQEFAETIAKAQKKAQQAAEQAGTEPELPAIPLFPAVTYSGVTVDTKTSEILKKETVFGTDFQTYQDKLATIYAETHNLSADEKNTVGQAIYESTWYLAPDGLRFCYLGGDCVEFVTLPLSEVPYTF